MAAKAWKFEQLAGGERKTLTLQGWHAPHGRARKGAVITDHLKIRQEAKHYGGSVKPSRLVFGPKHEPFRLKGRFMDADLGAGQALVAKRAWKQFVADEKPVAISWGDIVHMTGLITEVIFGHEDHANITYELHVEVDEDEDLFVHAAAPPLARPPEYAKAIDAELKEWLSAIPTAPSGPSLFGQIRALKDDVLDAIDGAVSAVNAPSAMLLAIAEETDSFVDATQAASARMRAGAQQMKTAVAQLDETFSTRTVDGVLYTRTADTDIAWQSYKAEADVSATEILALLADMDRQCEIAQRGFAGSTVTAEANDSWETLSVRATGGPEDADKIREANGVRFGERPVTGRVYVLPTG